MKTRSALLAAGLLAALLPVAAAAQGTPVVVGAALSQTGFLADLAGGMRNALLLWGEQVNAAGGLLGRPVELRLYDDESDSLRSTPLYEQLIREDRAELLVGPFGSAATSMAAAVAERSRRVMINAGGASPAIHKRVYRYVFQVPPPSDTGAAGVMPLAAKFGLKSLVVASRNAAAAAPLLEELKAQAAKTGVALRAHEYYVADPLTGLAPFAARLKASGVDALVTPANAREAADLLRAFKAAEYLPKLFIARGVAEPEFIKRVGMDAEYSVGFSSYEPAAATPGNAAFVTAYRARYASAPDFYAACGWAAGKVLEAAVAKAGSFEQEALRGALADLETHTVLGAYKVAADGAQTAAQPFLVQILKGRREVIWPEGYRSAAPVLPMPAWTMRPAKP